MTAPAFTTRRATRADAAWMQAAVARIDRLKQDDYFQEMCLQQAAGLLDLLVAHREEGDYAGHVKVVWEAGYEPFREAGIPEIQDLLVRPRYRRQGVGSRLLDAAEALIAERSPLAGIGVGLYAAYGPAQRLYVLRGYVPDGRGAQYKDHPISGGQLLPFDDEAVLYMTKPVR